MGAGKSLSGAERVRKRHWREESARRRDGNGGDGGKQSINCLRCSLVLKFPISVCLFFSRSKQQRGQGWKE